MIPSGMDNSGLRVAVAMIGSRRHYAVPVLLERAGMLAHFYTDTYAGKGLLHLAGPLLSLSRRHPSIRRLIGRRCGIPDAKITAFNTLGLRYWWRLRHAKSTSETEAAFLWVGDRFNRLVCDTGLAASHAVYAFNGAAHRLFSHSRGTGVKCVLDQTIAPRRVQSDNALRCRDCLLDIFRTGFPLRRSAVDDRGVREVSLGDLLRRYRVAELQLDHYHVA